VPHTYNSWREFREELLTKTLHYAVESVPFYKSLSNLRVKGSTIDLNAFPIIGKHDVTTRLWEFVVFDHFPDYVISTGGTTDVAPSISFRDRDEYEAATYFFSGLPPGEIPQLETIQEFTLDVFLNTNGYYWRKPAGWPVLSIALEQPGHVEMIKSFIKDGLVVRGRSIPARRIQSQNGPLRTLTGYLWATDFFPRDFGIKTVLVYGSHLSSVWRKRLRDLWGTDITTLYGLSEFTTGNAMQCDHCGSYHYWTAWPEFLALDGTGPVETGDAILLLTSLIPFTRVQPRIRYMTGDIVTVTGYCKVADQAGFRFRGRDGSSAIARQSANSQVLMSEIEVTEVLDQLPDINCRPHASEQPLWSDHRLQKPPFRMGFPKFAIQPPGVNERNGNVTVFIETTFDPGLETTRADKLKNQFLDTLSAQFPGILERLRAFDMPLDVQLLAPDSLKLRIKSAA
jgi:phenylacetate-coenzyme A ligase PaaK-like adenylate-forming protein